MSQAASDLPGQLEKKLESQTIGQPSNHQDKCKASTVKIRPNAV